MRGVSPAASVLERLRLPRLLAAVLIVLATAGLLALVIALISAPLAQWVTQVPELGARLVNDHSSPALEPLSERERDILHLLALGYTNQEIGRKLYISVRTVDTHRAHIMRKLQLETRAELVMFALANGVIGPSVA